MLNSPLSTNFFHSFFWEFIVESMVLLLCGSLENDAHKWNEKGQFDCVKAFVYIDIHSESGQICPSFKLEDYTCATWSEITSNISTMYRVRRYYNNIIWREMPLLPPLRCLPSVNGAIYKMVLTNVTRHQYKGREMFCTRGERCFVTRGERCFVSREERYFVTRGERCFVTR